MGNKSKHRINKVKKGHSIQLPVPAVIGIEGFDPRSFLITIPQRIPQTSAGDATSIDFALNAIATNTWRAVQKMLDVESHEPKPGMERVFRHIEAIQDALKGLGVETVDHTGQRYDTGSALKVITSEKRAGLNREEIIETLKPTVRFNGRLLQQGEVVVGEPVSQGEAAN